MSQQPSWFTEAHQASGSSIGYRVEKLLHAEKTPFQTIEIHQTTDWGKLMVIDGCVMLTSRDNYDKLRAAGRGRFHLIAQTGSNVLLTNRTGQP